VLRTASTRGDGLTGENITPEHADHPEPPAPSCGRADGPLPALLEVRGEVFLPIAAFRRLKPRGARTPVSRPSPIRGTRRRGSLKQLDPAVTARTPPSTSSATARERSAVRTFATHWDTLQGLAGFGLRPVPRSRVLGTLDEVLRLVHRPRGRSGDTLPLRESTGWSLKVNDVRLQRRLGEISRSPRWAVAFKFKARQATTRIREIVPSVGRTGVLTPVAELEPVAVGGVTVRNGLAPQHGRDRTQGHPRRRHRAARARGGRDPLRREGRPREAERG